jgi:hypothetical protein
MAHCLHAVAPAFEKEPAEQTLQLVEASLSSSAVPEAHLAQVVVPPTP